MRARGRPRTSTIERREQLRLAKRAQRARQRSGGIVDVQLALPAPVAAKLAVARRAAEFPQLLERWLDRNVVKVADYPQLQDLTWSRADAFIPAREAWQLYERNWRFVEPGRLDRRERELIARLRSEFDGGEIGS